jgi:hypothetical protein
MPLVSEAERRLIQLAEDMQAEDAQADMVNHPPHYTSHPSGVECIQITRHYKFAIGNAIKYLWRAGLKDAAVNTKEIEDLKKAVWYIQDRIAELEGKH